MPPWASAMPRLTERPRPVPCPDSFVVKNGSKMRPASATGTPGPLSDTSTNTRWPSTPVRTAIAASRRGSDGLLGVQQQVEHDLLNLLAVDDDDRNVVRQLFAQLDVRRPAFEGAEHERRAHDFVQVGDRPIQRRLAGEGQQMVDDLRDAVGVGVNLLQIVAHLFFRVAPEQQLGEADDALQRVVDLVRDAGDQLTDR